MTEGSLVVTTNGWEYMTSKPDLVNQNAKRVFKHLLFNCTLFDYDQMVVREALCEEFYTDTYRTIHLMTMNDCYIKGAKNQNGIHLSSIEKVST